MTEGDLPSTESLPKCHCKWGLVSLKPGTRLAIHVCQVDAGTQVLEPSFPGSTLAGDGTWKLEPRLQPRHSNKGCGLPSLMFMFFKKQPLKVSLPELRRKMTHLREAGCVLPQLHTNISNSLVLKVMASPISCLPPLFPSQTISRTLKGAVSLG